MDGKGLLTFSSCLQLQSFFFTDSGVVRTFVSSFCSCFGGASVPAVQCSDAPG